MSSLTSFQISRSAPGAQYRLASRINCKSGPSRCLSFALEPSGNRLAENSFRAASIGRHGRISFPTRASWPCFLLISLLREAITLLPQRHGSGTASEDGKAIACNLWAISRHEASSNVYFRSRIRSRPEHARSTIWSSPLPESKDRSSPLMWARSRWFSSGMRSL